MQDELAGKRELRELRSELVLLEAHHEHMKRHFKAQRAADSLVAFFFGAVLVLVFIAALRYFGVG